MTAADTTDTKSSKVAQTGKIPNFPLYKVVYDRLVAAQTVRDFSMLDFRAAVGYPVKEVRQAQSVATAMLHYGFLTRRPHPFDPSKYLYSLGHNPKDDPKWGLTLHHYGPCTHIPRALGEVPDPNTPAKN
jgi:hypothetical protein